jgi:hypothetical protein
VVLVPIRSRATDVAGRSVTDGAADPLVRPAPTGDARGAGEAAERATSCERASAARSWARAVSAVRCRLTRAADAGREDGPATPTRGCAGPTLIAGLRPAAPGAGAALGFALEAAPVPVSAVGWAVGWAGTDTGAGAEGGVGAGSGAATGGGAGAATGGGAGAGSGCGAGAGAGVGAGASAGGGCGDAGRAGSSDSGST